MTMTLTTRKAKARAILSTVRRVHRRERVPSLVSLVLTETIRVWLIDARQFAERSIKGVFVLEERKRVAKQIGTWGLDGNVSTRGRCPSSFYREMEEEFSRWTEKEKESVRSKEGKQKRG
uniref:Uncharacterized protein n=1 Tax=Vespula pensylvanica TaxID=30213 RepID=A0A834NRQ1_VESPE|nr:hypothetical protein H0235_011199 [Vespula pensylvanica]